MDTNNDKTEGAVSPESAPAQTPAKAPRKKRVKPVLDLSRYGPDYKVARKKKPAGQLTPAEKAQAAALWRSGEVTLEDLAKQFGKRPETFSRLFSEMGIKKGELADKHQEAVQKEIEARLLGDAAEHALRIAKVKEEHFKMADGLGKLIWSELVQAKRDGKAIERLRGTMHTLQMAAAALSNVRKELYDILRVEQHEEKDKDDELPELRIAELTHDQMDQLRQQGAKPDEMDIPELPGGDLAGDDEGQG